MMDQVQNALSLLNSKLTSGKMKHLISFEDYLNLVSSNPEKYLRNIFQVFHDMISYFLVGQEKESSADYNSSAGYNCKRLFEESVDRPFFSDRLFAHRLFALVESLKRGAQQNKIYIFNGPPGCGKSTFLNNLLCKFEEYANSTHGIRYEIVWHINPDLFSKKPDASNFPLFEQLVELFSSERHKHSLLINSTFSPFDSDGFLDIACPSHDNPLLIVPTEYREQFIKELLPESEYKERIFTEKNYQWILKDKACTFCSTLYKTLLGVLQSPDDIHSMICARPYRFNRRTGEGISVFNPGDLPVKNSVIHNLGIQARLNTLFNNGENIHYLYSRYAKTNNGIYALMDIKSFNYERFIELHNIISEGIHKVEDIEENVSSLLLGIMNPEDQHTVKDLRSFSDRIEYINIPYVMDINTEVAIYKNTFGKEIESLFLPGILLNFARIIVSSRLSTRSDALYEWISDPRKYLLYCDENLQLLKMEIYADHVPEWLFEEDRKKLSSQRKRRILAESDYEGMSGISGRDSLKIFNDFLSAFSKQNKLITMSMLVDYFSRKNRDLLHRIPCGFLESLMRMYNFTVLQQVKESLYYYNEKQIARDIVNYLYAVNFEPPVTEICSFTNDTLKITDEYLFTIESRIIGTGLSHLRHQEFRDSIQKEYTTKTLTQEIMLEKKIIYATDIFRDLHTRYIQNIKEKVLDPFLDNANFRRAIKDYHLEEFKTYDKKIRVDVKYLLRNLQKKFGYTEQGAQDVCMYVIDNKLAKMFGKG
jgi:predicted Ser/Thr protein kinase